MWVGINHPWITCGHDFGPRPPAWGGEHARRDWGAVRRELEVFRALGLRATRFWLLGGGVNYPAGEDPRGRFAVEPLRQRGGARRWLDGRALRRRAGSRDARFGTRFVTRGAPLPTLPRAYLDDFRALLAACDDAGVRLLPSLVSFELFHPIEIQRGDVPSRGRAALVFGDERRPDPAQIERFLDATLSPLLEVCAERPSALYAFEVANEPDWVVEGGPLHARLHGRRLAIMPKTVPRDAMARFLERGVDRITKAGLLASVGTKQADPRWMPPSLRAKLARLGAEGRYVHQLHHYPSPYEPARLPDHESLPIRPCLVGELPTAQARPLGLHAWCWPEGLAHYRAELDPARYLEARLRLIEARGYPAALVWGAHSTDGMSAWGPNQQAQVARYVGAPARRSAP